MIQTSCWMHLFSHLTLKCDLDLWPNHMVLAHYTPSHYGDHLYQVILIKFQQLMKELWTKQSVLVQFIIVWPWPLSLWHDASFQFDIHVCQVILQSIHKWQNYGLDKLYHIWLWRSTLTLNLSPIFMLTAHRLKMVNICVKFF